MISGAHIGRGVIEGVECEHLAFRGRDTDWQIWVQLGDRPLPRKCVITSKAVAAAPEYTVVIKEWKTDDQPSAADFVCTPPAGARSLILRRCPMGSAYRARSSHARMLPVPERRFDVFDTDGHLLRRFTSQGTLNSPWGLTRTSFGFGQFSGDILVGNFGDGLINVFDSQGKFLGGLFGPEGQPIQIDALWSLSFGGGQASRPDDLYFTAGPNEQHGLFGTITLMPNGNTVSADTASAISISSTMKSTSMMKQH
jgi:hypothetical protein